MQGYIYSHHHIKRRPGIRCPYLPSLAVASRGPATASTSRNQCGAVPLGSTAVGQGGGQYRGMITVLTGSWH